MKKKTVSKKINKSISRMEEKTKERHRRQEEEYGRDEFLFGAEEYTDEEEFDEDLDDEEYSDEDFDDEEYSDRDFDDEEYSDRDFDDEYTDEDFSTEKHEAELPEFDEEDPDFFTRDVPKSEVRQIRKATGYYEDESEEDDDDYDFLGEALERTEYERKSKKSGRGGKKRGDAGFFGAIISFFTNMSMADRLIVATGVSVLIIVIVAGTVFANARTLQKQIDSFAEVGKDYEGIEIIGERGLTASIDARASYVAPTEIVEEASVEEEPEEVVEEKETENQVVMKASSIQSDLKIKFSNKETGKLITDVVFAIKVTGDNGKTYEWADENKDGLIYHTEVPNGTYSIEMKDLEGAEAEKYLTASKVTGITVTDKIAYKKVDVADEVKKESEVNAAAEDTGVQDTAVESTLTDTVEWVESTKEKIGGSEEEYKEISLDDIASPTETSSADKVVTKYSWYMPYVAAEATASAPEASDSVSVSLSSTAVSMHVGETVMISATVTGADNNSVTWETSDSSIATVSGGYIEGLKAGTVTITAVSVADSSKKETCTITINGTEENKNTENKDSENKDSENKNDNKSDGSITITLDKSSLSLKKGESDNLSATVENATDASVEWASGDAGIATVSEGKVTAVSSGTTVIMAWSKQDTSKTAKCTVVVEGSDGESKKDKGNSDEKLLSKSGKQVYYKNSKGKYVEATAADYNSGKTFFVKEDGGDAVYKYTGWQTIDGNTYFFDKNGNFVTGEQVIQGAKYSFDSNGHLSTGSGTMGIDVSKWNGDIDWNAVKNSGVSFVIIRCGYRGSSTGALIEDPKFRSNISGAKAAGLSVGAYFFTQATSEVEAVEEASMAINLCSSYGLNLPLFLDVEGSGGRGDRIDSSTRTAVCKAFCQTVQNSGFASGIYANKTWLDSKMNASALSSFKIWLAQYAASRTYSSTRVDYWQYTSKGKVSGIKGNVDLNIRY